MKKILFTTILAFSSIPALAAEKSLWDCDGTNVEGAGISVRDNQLMGSVSFDCWPGGGICTADTSVSASYDKNGDLVYRGAKFWMIVHTSQNPGRNGYRAHMIATDTEDGKDMGGGLTFNGFLDCHQ